MRTFLSLPLSAILTKNEVDKFMMMQFCIRDTIRTLARTVYRFKNPIRVDTKMNATLNTKNSRTSNVIGFEIYFFRFGEEAREHEHEHEHEASLLNIV